MDFCWSFFTKNWYVLELKSTRFIHTRGCLQSIQIYLGTLKVRIGIKSIKLSLLHMRAMGVSSRLSLVPNKSSFKQLVTQNCLRWIPVFKEVVDIRHLCDASKRQIRPTLTAIWAVRQKMFFGIKASKNWMKDISLVLTILITSSSWR